MLGVKPAKAGLWHNQTEVLIGFCGLGLAVILLAFYEFSGQGDAMRSAGGFNGYAAFAYLAFAAVRLLWVTQIKTGAIFGWVTATIDVLALSTILHIFGASPSESRSSAQPPAYTLYYVLIAMHAMRLNAMMVLSLGVVSILASVLMGAALLDTGTGSQAFMATEVEKLLSLMMFIVLTAIGVMRARSLLADAGMKESAEIKLAEFERGSIEKTEIMAAMGTDLQAPMENVSEMVDALRGTKLSAKQIEFLDAIDKSGGELLSIIEDIVDYTRLEMGELEIRQEEFELREFIENTCDSMGEKARAKRIDLMTHIAPGSPDFVVGDEERLGKVLINLIDNAITYTEEGSVLVSVASKPINGRTATFDISVKDTGIGISEDRLEMIFAPAAQPEGAGKRRYGVMGLGLSVSRGIVRANGGDIKVESTLDEGSEFSFGFPVAYKFRSKEQQSPFKSAQNLDQVQILIVDDEPMCANILEKKLNENGMMPKIVTSAEKAATAIEAAYNAGKPFAFALIDYDMPDWSGLQLTKLIRTREQLAATGVIAFSSAEELGLQKSFENEDVIAFLEKPFKTEDLEAALVKALRAPRMTTSTPIEHFSGSENSEKKSA